MSIRQQIIESHQFLYSLAPDTLLTIDLAAPLLGKSPATVRTNVSTNPSCLPSFFRVGRRILFKKSDIDDFLLARRVQVQPVSQPNPAPPAPPIKVRRGRPTKAEQLAKIASHK